MDLRDYIEIPEVAINRIKCRICESIKIEVIDSNYEGIEFTDSTPPIMEEKSTYNLRCENNHDFKIKMKKTIVLW